MSAVRRAGFAAWMCTLGVLPNIAWAATTDPADPPQGQFHDEWFVVLLGDQQAGHMHSTASRKGDEILSSETIQLAVTRAGQTIEIVFGSDNTETVEGKPLAFDSTMKMAATEMSSRGKIENGRVIVESTQFGVASRAEYDLPETAIMTWGLRLAMLEKGLKPGTEYTLDTYAPGQNPASVIPVSVKVIGAETIDLFGRKTPAIRVDQVTDIMGNRMESQAWVDEEGNTLRADQSIMGLTMSVLKADRARALSKSAGGEIFMDTLVKPDKPIDRLGAKAVVYRLRLTDGSDGLEDLPDTGMQKVKPNKDGSIELRVRRLDHRALAEHAGALGDLSADVTECLAAGAMINWEDPAVMNMAQEARGKETNPYKLARKLREYVSDVIREKNLDIGFATASEVARNKEGDCSEHGVLLAALGRACGIPSHVVAGLVYVDEFEGRTGVFGFHMWTQMFIDGQWVDLDAAQDETDCNPTHIAVATSSLQEEGLMELAGPLLKLMMNLEIEVLKVEK